LSRDFVPTREGLANGSADAIARAACALIEAVRAPAKVFLFGSHARGDAGEHSDFDFLVIEHEVDDRFGEMARLSRILGRLLIPADVIVVSEQYAQQWGAVKGTLLHQALREGHIIAES
jgi:predicted nucleotidyltransferase